MTMKSAAPASSKDKKSSPTTKATTRKSCKATDDKDFEIKIPVTVVKRTPSETRKGEAYVLNFGDKRYIAGCTQARDPKYEKVVTILAQMLNTGKVSTKSGAVKWLASNSI